MGGFDSRQKHRAEGGTHARGAVQLGDLHAREDHARHDLASVVDDVVLGSVHIQRTHARDTVHKTQRLETLHARGTKGTIMATAAHEDLREKEDKEKEEEE